MKKRVFIFLIIIIIIIGTMRIYSINSVYHYPITLNFELNEEVNLEGDFFNSISEDMTGYSISVISTKLITIDNFLEEHKELDTEYFRNQDYVYLITANFKNSSNEFNNNSGINLNEYIIQNGAYINYIEHDIFPYVNDFQSFQFCLSPNSNKNVVIPFTISEQFIDIEKFKTGNPQLVVSLYPHKKSISINSRKRNKGYSTGKPS